MYFKDEKEKENKQPQFRLNEPINWKQFLYTPQVSIKAEEFKRCHKNTQKVQRDLKQFKDKEQLFILTNFQLAAQGSSPNTFKLIFHEELKIYSFTLMLSRILLQQQLRQLSARIAIGIFQLISKIAVPFLLLKQQRKYKLKVCYGYFENFMVNYFPAMLTQKIVNNKKQLPMTAVSLNLLGVLLNYFYPQVFYHLKHHGVPLSMIFTAELMTVFAKNMKIELVYEIWAFFIQNCKKKTNKNQLKEFYYTQFFVLLSMCLGLVALRRQQIMQQSQQEIFQFTQKQLKNFEKKQQLQQWFIVSLRILDEIPQQFYQQTTKILGGSTKAINGIRTQEMYEEMMKKQNEFLNYLMEKDNIGELLGNEPKCMLITIKNNKSIKNIKNKFKQIQVVELLKSTQKRDSQVEQILEKIYSKITKNNKISFVLIVIQKTSINEQKYSLELMENIIKHIQVKFKSKCFKISQEDLIKNTLNNEIQQSKNPSNCQII